MANFQNRDTIKCWRNVRDPDTLAYMDPSTSMTIAIYSPNQTKIVDDVNMTKSETGKYYYDFQSEGHNAGHYVVKYTAVDGEHKSTLLTSFDLENEH